jgi:hypothetical protein
MLPISFDLVDHTHARNLSSHNPLCFSLPFYYHMYRLPPTATTTVRSYVYQTGHFTTETRSTGSSLFRIVDKRHLNYQTRRSGGFASFEFPDGILPGVRTVA